MRTTRQRGVSGLISVTASDKLFELLDEYQSDILTPSEKLNGAMVAYSQQILRIVSDYMIIKESEKEGETT